MGFFPKAENFAQEIVVHGCARPWFVYVKTFVPAFIKLFLTLTFWDLGDIIRSYGKTRLRSAVPASGRGWRHKGNKIVLTPAQETNKVYRQGLKTILILTEPLEKIGFAWLLYSAGDQFFYDWQLLLERSIYCSDSGLGGPFQRSRPGGSNIGILPEGAATPLGTLEQNRGNWSNTGFAVSLEPGFYRVFFGLEVEGPLGGISNVRARLRVTGIATTFIESAAASAEQGETMSLLAEDTFVLIIGGTVGWELAGPAVPAGLKCNGGDVIVVANDVSA